MTHVVGARQHAEDDLQFVSADDQTVLTFSRGSGGTLQVAINGEWLWLTYREAAKLADFIERNF